MAAVARAVAGYILIAWWKAIHTIAIAITTTSTSRWLLLPLLPLLLLLMLHLLVLLHLHLLVLLHLHLLLHLLLLLWLHLMLLLEMHLLLLLDKNILSIISGGRSRPRLQRSSCIHQLGCCGRHSRL
jgi:hypothetical protein